MPQRINCFLVSDNVKPTMYTVSLLLALAAKKFHVALGCISLSFSVVADVNLFLLSLTLTLFSDF